MSAWVWVLSFTILGSIPEHGTIAKFQTKKECVERLETMKQEVKQQNKQLVGSCTMMLKS